jgi:hypothetical protein
MRSDLELLRQRLRAKQAERAADPGYRERPPSDWRPQDVADVEELLSAGQQAERRAGREDK